MSARREPDIRKATLRNDVDFKLASMSEEERSRQSKVIVEKILNHPKYKTAKRICLFLSLSSEVDTSRVLQDILTRGASAFVPQYSKGIMNMLKVENGDMETMVQTSWGIKQHAKDAVRENALDCGGVDLVIAPGAAFSISGRRCGHGGGYYDRYLSELQRRHAEDPGGFRAPYILAVAFNEQIYSDDSIPMNDGDVMVHEVVTA